MRVLALDSSSQTSHLAPLNLSSYISGLIQSQIGTIRPFSLETQGRTVPEYPADVPSISASECVDTDMVGAWRSVVGAQASQADWLKPLTVNLIAEAIS